MRKEIEILIIEWAFNKGLLFKENTNKQYIKLIEEVGELASSLLKNDKDSIIDSIGDIEVVLTILKKQLYLDQDYPILCAWNEIKERTGKTKDGVFIKD